GFRCRSADMAESDLQRSDRHRHQEAEANRFAIELLAPPRKILGQLEAEIDLRRVLGIAKDCEISREAAARRYAELHESALAVLFSRNGRLQVRGPVKDLPGAVSDKWYADTWSAEAGRRSRPVGS